MAATKHSVLSASASERWLACPGSVRLSEGVPRRTSKHAEEGSAAHALAENCLRKGLPASTLVGRTVREHIVTDEMADAVQVYLDVIQADRMALPLSTLEVEVGFHLDWLDDDLWGTCDACLSQPFGRLIIYDFKYGQGVLVSPENNPQAMYYALGACHGSDHDEVELVIVQPRGQAAKPVKRWTTDVKFLEDWGANVLRPAAAIAKAPDAPLNPGDHCRWCPALTLCPKVRETVYSRAAVAFDKYAVPTTTTPELPAVSAMTVEQLVKVYEVMPLLKMWSEEVDTRIRELVEAGADGVPYKFVAGRKTRKWKDEAATIAALKDRTALFEQKLKSVKAVEDSLRKSGQNVNDLMAGLVDVSVSKSLVPIDDDRPAIAGKAAEAFADYKEQ